jgi:trimethylamine:corrinoid methyltransferase-like protein
MRPKLSLLSDDLKAKIISEGRELLCGLGVEIHNPQLLALLGDHGAEVELEKQHARLNQELIDKSLATVPAGFKLYDVLGHETHDLSDDNVYFTPGSAAINILDNGKMRKPQTAE